MSKADFKGRLSEGLKKIKEKGVYTFLIMPEDYALITEGILKYLIGKLNKKGIYVTLNNPC